MSGVSKFNVWSEHLEEADVEPVETLRPETALLLVLAACCDDGVLFDDSVPDYFWESRHEDWFVRDLATTRLTRYRVSAQSPSGFDVSVVQLRACRVCGCIDEQACSGGCHWVEPDLCSACVPREAA